MTELELKYGCNPNQKPARIFMEEGSLPVRCSMAARLYQLHGRPQLLAAGEGPQRPPARPAASFKHVSPPVPPGPALSDVEKRIYFARRTPRADPHCLRLYPGQRR